MIAFTRHGADEVTLDVEIVEAPWTSSRATRTTAHQLLQSPATLYTFTAPEPRAGRMRFRFHTAATAHEAAEFFAVPAEFSFDPESVPEIAARFVVTGGSIDVSQDLRTWVVAIPWREVLE